jgi:hypothetical protein
LGRYQDLIDKDLIPEWQQLNQSFGPDATLQSVTEAMKNMSAYNLLNTKYIILNPQSAPLSNPHALGPAWFAEEIKQVATANEEIEAVSGSDLSFTAIVNEEFSSQIQNIKVSGPTHADDKIELKELRPNSLKYSSSSTEDRLAIFSEIWYPHGWEATIDGDKTEYIRANYLLRAMVVPAGQHEIEFIFAPKSLKTGQLLALISSILVLLLALAWLFQEYKKSKLKDKEAA